MVWFGLGLDGTGRIFLREKLERGWEGVEDEDDESEDEEGGDDE